MKKESNSSIYWATVSLLVVFVLMISLMWYNSHKQFSEFKKENRLNFEKIAFRAESEPFEIITHKSSDSTVVISTEEINKIGKYVNSLADEVKKESNRAESIVDKDIDRLNLYMAIGIGFMTLLGIFVPLLVNFNSGQDLRDKQNRIDEDLRTVKNKFEGFDDDVKKLKNQSEIIEKLSESTMRVLINDANSQLQNAVGRFYYVGQTLMARLIRDRDNSKLLTLITDIKTALINCNQLDGHLIENNVTFRNNIEDFIVFLQSEDLRLNVIFDRRSDNNVFQRLINDLQALLEPTGLSADDKYANVDQALVRLIELIINRNENQPAA
jgi:hypothetical protein